MIRFAVCGSILLFSAAATAAQPSALVMPTRINPKFGKASAGDAIDAKLRELVKDQGYALASPKLTDEEQECREDDCLPTLAAHHDLDAVLAAFIQPDPQVGTEIVRVLLYRKVSPDSVRNESAACPSCEVTRAGALAIELGRRLLRSDPGTASPPLDPIRLLPPTASLASHPEGHQTVYRALGFTSVGLFAGSLALTAAMGALNGDCTASAANGTCRASRDTTAGIAVGAVGLGVFGAASAALLYLGYRHVPAKQVAIAPAIGPGQAGASILGRF